MSGLRQPSLARGQVGQERETRYEMTTVHTAARPHNSQAHRALPLDSVRLRLDLRGSPTATPPRFGDDSTNPDVDAPGDITISVRREMRVRSVYERQHPERIAAHRAVKAALKAGRLAKPIFCPRCFRRKPVEDGL